MKNLKLSKVSKFIIVVVLTITLMVILGVVLTKPSKSKQEESNVIDTSSKQKYNYSVDTDCSAYILSLSEDITVDLIKNSDYKDLLVQIPMDDKDIYTICLFDVIVDDTDSLANAIEKDSSVLDDFKYDLSKEGLSKLVFTVDKQIQEVEPSNEPEENNTTTTTIVNNTPVTTTTKSKVNVQKNNNPSSNPPSNSTPVTKTECSLDDPGFKAWFNRAVDTRTSVPFYTANDYNAYLKGIKGYGYSYGHTGASGKTYESDTCYRTIWYVSLYIPAGACEDSPKMFIPATPLNNLVSAVKYLKQHGYVCEGKMGRDELGLLP